MSTSKYTPAPQHDVDESQYSQAPPSYQNYAAADNAALRDGAALLDGATRSSDDNVPDDFKFGGTVSEAAVEIRMAFIRKVYSILTVQLFLTAAVSSVSFFSESYKTWIQSNSWLMWVSLISTFVFLGLTFWKRKSYPMNFVFLTGFTLTEAYMISLAVSFSESRIVLEAVVLTAGIFIALTLFACQTKYDFTAWQSYLFGGLWVLILVGFMAAFFPQNSTFELAMGIGAALIFSAYILVDTQMVMKKFHPDEEIAAAISLYLDILNLFLAILRILQSQQNN